MKKLIFISFLFFALTSCGQKKLPIKEVKVSDGYKYEYTLLPKQDSLRWYNGGGLDTFRVFMTFEKISTGFPLPDVITDVDNALSENSLSLVYTPMVYAGDNIVNPGGWTFLKNQLTNVAHHDNTLAFIQSDGWVDFTFSGYKIEYWAEQLESYGIAGVSIDGGPEQMIDLYDATNINNSRVVFTADSLENNASHKIRVRYTGQRNPNANSGAARITLDKFRTFYGGGVMYQTK